MVGSSGDDVAIQDRLIYFSLELKHIHNEQFLNSNKNLILSSSRSLKEGDLVVIFRLEKFELLEIKNADFCLNNCIQFIGKVVGFETRILNSNRIRRSQFIIESKQK